MLQGLLLAHEEVCAEVGRECMQVAELGVPYIMMHMRGDPGTMQSAENTAYEDVCADVGRELQAAADAAMRAGIEPWRIIPDPGG